MLNLVDLSITALEEYFLSIQQPKYRAIQLIHWIYQWGITDFQQMDNLSLNLKNWLAKHTVIQFPQVLNSMKDEDGTVKWIFKLADGALIEAVYIPEGKRGTVCCSSQVGCAIGCQFCATGNLGFKRNLSLSEILGQLWIINHALSSDGSSKHHLITNVVFMGMGEPLLNYATVKAALEILLHDHAYGLSKYRVTISTAGILPFVQKLNQETEVALAVSLHATTNKLRDYLVPINKDYPFQKLINYLDHYFKDPRRSVTIEYIMLAEINDTPKDAERLAVLLANGNYKVNLIPANPVEHTKITPSSPERIDAFRNSLLAHKITTITRKPRGEKIVAACGQLAARNYAE